MSGFTTADRLDMMLLLIGITIIMAVFFISLNARLDALGEACSVVQVEGVEP